MSLINLDYQSINNRLIENDKYLHTKLAVPLRKLVSLSDKEAELISFDPSDEWRFNGELIGKCLTGFIGVIDLETTGLTGHHSVICACGIGYLGDEFGVVNHGSAKQIHIEHSIIANINQPFDRQFYFIENGKDTNIHLDLSSMAKVTLGSPNAADPFSGYVSMSELNKYYFGETVDKSRRDQLIQGELSFDEIAEYCFDDVLITAKLSKQIIREYCKAHPSPMSLYGQSLRHFSIPISPEYPAYVKKCKAWYEDQLAKIQVALDEAAIKFLLSDELSESHQHLADQYPKKYSSLKSVSKTINKLPESKLKDLLIEQKDRGNERVLFEFIIKVAKRELTLSSSSAALLVEATYEGEVLKYDRQRKVWSYGDEVLVNKSDPKAALLTPFSKGYVEDPALDSTASDVVLLLKSIQFWVSFHSRVEDIYVDEFGYHVPDYIPAHTLTGRSADKIFLLAKPDKKKGGSEFMRLIQAKPGYKLVTADFDSAELVYAAHFANHWVESTSQLGTEFAQIVFEGDSMKKTDIHSLVAALIGFARVYAKNLTYGANYFQGKKGRIELIQKSLHCSYREAEMLAKKYEDFYVNGKAKPYFESVKKQAEYCVPTALLLAEVPRGLKRTPADDYFTTKCNRSIQALGSDHLNVLLCDVDRLINEHEIDSTLILTRHDEVLYEVAERDVELMREILQSAHQFSVSMLLARLGIEEAIDRWLLFSSVDVLDHYKPVDHDKELPTPTELIDA